jgi:ferritin-like metal-binding protein YciE
MTKEQILEYCLNDAYAMEEGGGRLLRAQQGLPGNTEALEDKLAEWIDEGEANAQEIRECIEALDCRPSTKDGMSPQLLEALEPLVTAKLPDQEVKNAVLLHALMHFGHASALALVRGGEALDEPEVSKLAKKLGKQKMANATWLEEHIPEIWDVFRDQQLTGEESETSGRPAMAFNERLGDKTKSELQDIAKEKGVPYSNKNKEELIDELEREQ